MTVPTIPGGGRRKVRRPSVLLAAPLILLVVPQLLSARADDVPLRLSVLEEDGLYTVTAQFEVEGSPETVIAVLTDYERIPEFMPGVKTSVVRERGIGRAVIEQDAISKFLFFSTRVHLLLEIRQEGGTIRFRDLAAESFTRYEGTWRVTTERGKVLVWYELSAAPAFAVPGYVLRRLFRRDSAEMATQLRREIARRSLECRDHESTN